MSATASTRCWSHQQPRMRQGSTPRASNSTSRSMLCATRSRPSRTASGRPMPSTSALSHQLYTELFGPFAADLGRSKHLIFEPDGAMLRLAAEPAGDGSGVGRHLQEARGRRRRRRVRLPRHQPGSGATATSRRRSAPARSPTLRSARPSAAPSDYLGLGENTPPSGCRGADPGGGRSRLHASAVVLDAPDLGEGAAGRCGHRLGLRSQGRAGRHWRRVHRHRPRGAHRSRSVPDHPLRDPRRGHLASAEVRGAARAADELRRQWIGRAADLPRDLRPAPRRRPGDPVRLRHRRQGQRGRDPAGRPGDAAATSRSTAWCAPSSAPVDDWSSPATGRSPTTTTRPSG